MIVIFGRSRSISSYAIRVFTWSKWSHCGIVDGSTVIEATAKHGVVVTPITEFIDRYDSVDIAEVPHCGGYTDRALAEVGAPYDWLAIISMVIRRRWDDKGKWFCSELVAHAAGVFRRDSIKRVTPQHIWMISKSKDLPMKIVCMSFRHADQYDIELVLESVAAASDGWVFRMYVDGSNVGYFDKDLEQNKSPYEYFSFWMPYVNNQLDQLAGTAPPAEAPEWVQGYESELKNNWVYSGGHVVVDV